MRFWRRPLAVIAVLAFTAVGCTEKTADGTHTGANQPGTAPSADGSGVMLGSPDAAVQLETFIEPQCPYCARFESVYGDKIAGYLRDGRLAMTYRPVTYLDQRLHNDASARVVNALYLLVDVATSATVYQAFVQDLYQHQSFAGPLSNNDIAAIARESGVSEWVVTRIAAGDPAADGGAKAAANHVRLKNEHPTDPVSPTVYDLRANKVIDYHVLSWLDGMFS
jgi:hypothetical protein